MFDQLRDPDYRHAFVEENEKTGIAFQIRALREKNGWTQAELGQRAGKPQNVVSRLEDPDYGKVTLTTMFDLARAFDVALLVKFVSFSRLVAELKDVSPRALAVPSFTEEQNYFDKVLGDALTQELSALEPAGQTRPLFCDGLGQPTRGAAELDGLAPKEPGLELPTRKTPWLTARLALVQNQASWRSQHEAAIR